MIGDCDNCGHSVAYHVPLVGCIKCSCDEFRARRSFVGVATLLAALLLCACTDEAASRAALESHGFTDIDVGGYAAFSCGKDDTYATEFTATNPAGNRVSGAVCCGWLKGCTVRF